MSRSLTEYYHDLLKESKGQAPPSFDDTSRGVLLALIKERPTIFNSTAKLTKDDVLASFQQCSAVLSNMDPSFGIWTIIEKWCWIVECYVRCSLTSPPVEWRYNNTLDYLKPFASANYPYLGCITKKRRNELTKMYAEPDIIKLAEATDDVEFPAGIFRDEMHYLSGEEQFLKAEMEAVSLSRTVGQVVNAKRRGRPSKADKRSPVDQFIHLTPQSAQFQKLLENNGSTPTIFSAMSFIDIADTADNLGFTPSMYNALIELIQEKPEIWQTDHSDHGNIQIRDRNFEEILRKMIMKFSGTTDVIQLEKLTGPFIRTVWEALKERFIKEENLETISTWRHFLPLQFLSNRLMPPFHLENALIKTEDPSTSSGLTTRVTVASPAGSTQSDDSRMAASSPAIATQFVSNGNKSIKTVLDNLVARSMKEEQGNSGTTIIEPQDYSELKQMLEQNKLLKIDNENGPPIKRVKQENGSSPPGCSRTIVYNNDTRKLTQAPISTWVPPREDLAGKVKEDTIMASQPQKRPQATAVIKSGFPLEKQLKKMFQQTPSIIPVTAAASIAQRNGLLGLNQMAIPQTALQQALLKKLEPPTTMASMGVSAMPSVTATPQQLHQAQTLMNGMNGAMNGNSEPEDKWTLLGRMISIIAREVETRDPMSACELARDIQNCLYQYKIKSLRPKENTSQ